MVEEFPVNKSPCPDHVIETITRCFWPDIQAYWESEEGQTEFLEWKAEQEKKQQREWHEALPAAA